MPAPDPDPLEELLDAAGRAAQPTHPGWQELPQRLARTPQVRSRTWRSWLPLAAAAAAVLLFALWLSGLLRFGPGPELHAGPIEVQRLDVELTVLSAAATEGETLYMPLLQKFGPALLPTTPGLPGAVMLGARDRLQPVAQPPKQQTGQALVKDHRLILNLQKGDNLVRFTDVAATIDPTSVRLVSHTDPTGTQVIEQNFEYDLATADSLLKRYLDRPIVCISRDGAETVGRLVSFDAQAIVLRSDDGTQSLDRTQLRAVRLDEVPADLLVRPTLVWKLRAQKPGRHDTTLSYLCGLIKWQADYVAVVTPGQDRQPDVLDITGWVTLDNASGTSYEKAGLKLIAGDVNRVRDPWAALQRWEEGLPDGRGRYKQKLAPPLETAENKKEFVEKSFFEYHLYTLTAPSTVRDREIKQLALLQRTGVKASRRYVFEPFVHYSHVAVELLVKNEKENRLGLPLPKGRVTLEQRDVDGESAVLGHVQIDHTPVKEELTLRYGYAFDVTAEQRQTSVQTPPLRLIESYEARVRNHRSEEIQVRVVVQMPHGKNWTIPKTTMPWKKHDVQTIHYDFVLKPNAEQVIEYTVDYQY